MVEQEKANRKKYNEQVENETEDDIEPVDCFDYVPHNEESSSDEFINSLNFLAYSW